jgi:hypothetical protein
MIKTLTKIFAFSAIVKNLVETKKSKTEGITQLQKFPEEQFISAKKSILLGNLMLKALHQ